VLDSIPTAWSALSVKQPWAALILGGAKTIDVRTWTTGQRGPFLLHAAKIDDPRPEGWALVTTPELTAYSELRGGIVGTAELVEIVEYGNADSFARDAESHLNAPDWFRPPRLYGFRFANIRPLPFRRFPGNTFFFPVPGIRIEPPEGPATEAAA